MKITIEAKPEEIEKLLQVNASNQEQKDSIKSFPSRQITVEEKFANWDLYKDEYRNKKD